VGDDLRLLFGMGLSLWQLENWTEVSFWIIGILF